MELNLPIIDLLAESKNILIAGMGGGFDIFCGLPIYFKLRNPDRKVHLASYSFADISNYKGGLRLSETLKGIENEQKYRHVYFPELYLSRWFEEVLNEKNTIWCFHKTGTIDLLENYKILVEYLNIDSIILIDGGVDSLIRGNEAKTATLIEDAISLFTVNKLDGIPLRIVGCIGLGIELSLSYYDIFENIANLTASGAFLGSCSLAPKMEAYQLYEQAVLFVQNMKLQDPSVINSSIVSAVQGHYADYHLTEKTKGSKLWISPLMPLYWFFDLPEVAANNHYLSQMENTESFLDAMMAYMTYAELVKHKPISRIPLP